MHHARTAFSRFSDGAAPAASAHPALIEVAVPVGVDRTFVYGVPSDLAARLLPGSRVEVPFRRRVVVGVVVGRAARPPAGTLRSIRAVLDAEPALGEELLAFTRWLADYYAAPWGEVLRAALPAVLAPRRRRSRGDESRPSAEGEGDLATPTPAPEPTREQTNALALIERRLAAGAFRVVLLHGVTASGKTEVYLRAAAAALRLGGQVLVLVPEIGLSVQLMDRFVARLGSQVAILHSGLTDAERRSQWERVRSGRVPVVVGARSAIFAPLAGLKLIVVDEEHEATYKQDEVPRYHARDAAIVRAQMNDAVVILGSATPSLESTSNAAAGRYDEVKLERRVDGRTLPEVIIADMRRRPEEGGTGTARRGGATAQAVTVPAAATQTAAVPAAANQAAAVPAGTVSGTDATAATTPAATTAAATVAPATVAPATAAAVLTPRLRDALLAVLARGEQAILLVHRRGHSTFVQCTECGAVPRCPSCEVALTYHAVGHLLRCHHCNLRRPAPDRCAKCAGSRFWHGGVGTQRVEAELRRELPHARVLRMDLDTTRQRGAHRGMIETFARHEADILLGTQMVAKGLDFPEVSLVGVVSADTLLNLPDFRAAERFFQLLTQAAGRAGRGSTGGQVIIQTYIPEHPALVAAAAHDYPAFAAAAFAEREELGYPPCGAMARFHIDGPDEAPVLEVADRLGAALGQVADLSILGPAPLPLSRLRGRVRWHLTLMGRRRRTHGEARRVLRQVLGAGLPARVRLQLDVDPIHLL